MPQLSVVVRGACLALTVPCAAGTTARRAPRFAAHGPDARHAVITVGAFDFPESVLLAYLYADTLAGKGYPVRVLANLGTRELVDPALMAGLVQLVPEYTGSALEFASLGRVCGRGARCPG
jgi:osmoprotectant transport system substrate-binding protein